MAGNMMKNYEQQILSLTEAERNELAMQCLITVVSDGQGGFRFKDDAAFAMILAGAKIGIGKNRSLKQGERKLSKYIAEKALKNQSEELLTNEIKSYQLSEKAYDAVKMMGSFGWEVAMAYFRYILCWALADGVVEPELESRLESMFGLYFVLDLGNSGLESVSAPKVQLTGLEAEIALEFKNDENLTFLRDIQARFPNRSSGEVKRALDHLCEKGFISYVDTAVGMMYSLENAESIEIVRPNAASASKSGGTSKKCESAKKNTQKSASAKQSKKQDNKAEKQRKEEEKRQQAAVEEYEKEYAEMKKKQADFIVSETERIEKEYQEALASLSSKYEADCEANQYRSEAVRAERVQMERKLSEAGLFAFRKKTELQTNIEAKWALLHQLVAERSKIDSTYEAAKNETAAARKSDLDKLSSIASKKYPLPKDPRIPQQKIAAQQEIATQQRMSQSLPTAMQRERKNKRCHNCANGLGSPIYHYRYHNGNTRVPRDDEPKSFISTPSACSRWTA